ncbi:hypothetical protein DKP78_18260, partial [Enterococcus faecium]
MNIGILTGYVAETEDLKLAPGKTWEMDESLSTEGNIVIYLKEISDQRPERITVPLRRVLKVGLLQPAGVSVRQYNTQEEECLKFYHPQKTGGG